MQNMLALLKEKRFLLKSKEICISDEVSKMFEWF